MIGLPSTTGSARFALSDAFDAVQLPTVTLPGFTTVLVCALLCLAAAVGYLSGRMRGRWPVAGAVAALAVVMGFLTWAASGRELPFPVSNQFAGTLSLATPLVFGALCGVLCERSGVVNVSIEGQFLSAAFAAAIVGSLTQSVPAAMIAAVLAGLAMAALLAVFSINYLVNQVVGVVLNLLAIGLTGFLDQLVQPASINTTPHRCSNPFRFQASRRSRSSAACSSNRTSWPIWQQSRFLWSGWCSTGPPGACASEPPVSIRRRPTR